MTDDPKNKKTQPQSKPKTVFVTSQYSNYKDSNYTIESRPGVKTDITIATGDAKDSK